MPYKDAERRRQFEQSAGQRARTKKYREANRVSIQARMSAYREAHREELLEAARAHYRKNRQKYIDAALARNAKNRDRYRELKRRWLKKNRVKANEYAHQRWVRMRGAMTNERFTRNEIYERDGWLCGICGKAVEPKQASLDHILPIVHGGLHTRANVRLAHRGCNAKRGAKLDPEEVQLLRDFLGCQPNPKPKKVRGRKRCRAYSAEAIC